MNAEDMIAHAKTTAARLFDSDSEIIQRKDYEIENLQSRLREVCNAHGEQQRTIDTMLRQNSTQPPQPVVPVSLEQIGRRIG